MKIIALAGPAGSGKSLAAKVIEDTVGEILSSDDICSHSFAHPLKLGVEFMLYGADALGVDVDAFDQADKLVQIKHLGLCRRELWQLMGTEVCRSMEADFWIHVAELWLDDLEFHYCVIDDCRFENEAVWIRRYPGRIIHINRPNNPIKVPPHASEKGITKYSDDWIVHNDGTEAEFTAKLRGLVPALIQEMMTL